MARLKHGQSPPLHSWPACERLSVAPHVSSLHSRSFFPPCVTKRTHKKTESNNTYKKESQHEDKHRSCGQEQKDLHQNMKFFSATLLHVLLGRRVHSTCLVVSLSTPWHGEDRGSCINFCLPPPMPTLVYSPHADTAKGWAPQQARACSYFCVQIHAPPSARFPGRQQFLKTHVLEVLLRILF